MSALPSRVETGAGPTDDLDITAGRETSLSRLLILHICTRLLFMLLPGTFLGVWNLLAISSHRAAGSVSAAWIQAHDVTGDVSVYFRSRHQFQQYS